MTIVEKAAYLKGLTDGLGIEADSREGKLWGVLNDLLSDMAHEIEDLQSDSLDMADTIDGISEDLTYLEELTCDLDLPEDFMYPDDYDEDPDDIYDDDSDEADVEVEIFEESPVDEAAADDVPEADDDGIVYDGTVYDVVCPACGEEITIDDEILASGSIVCPVCGEELEFELDEEDEQ